MQYYDIIGDIHGFADKLESLLQKMDYQLINGAYKHQTRKAIFVGDYIDRGNQEAKTIHIVKSMVEADSALAIMGNHEFNAVCYATKHPDKSSEYLRPHNDRNFKLHQAYLAEFPFGSEAHQQTIDWFKTLPVYLDLEHIRIIHACWHQPSIKALEKILNKDKTIPDEIYITASTKGHSHFTSIENVVKALEKDLPPGYSYIDKGDNLRERIRVKWWQDKNPTYRNLALTVPEQNMKDIPDTPAEDVYTYKGSKPVFFGHYWMGGIPRIQSDKAACTDYSIALGGKLVAYRWNGEENLTNEHFIWAD